MLTRVNDQLFQFGILLNSRRGRLLIATTLLLVTLLGMAVGIAGAEGGPGGTACPNC